jgi:hypothetical protein
MTKKQVIKAIDHAQEYHLQQMEKVSLLVNGKKVKNPTPLSKDACEFGYWLYGEGGRIKKLLGIQFYKSMDLIHEYWHMQYEKIYNIYYDVEDDGIFTKLLGYKRKLSPQEHQEVQELYASLQQATDDLLEALIASKRRIIALKDRVFEEID